MRTDSEQEFRPGDLIQTIADDHITGVPLGVVGRIQRKLRASDVYKVRFDGYGFYEIRADDMCGCSKKAAQRARG